MAALSTNLRNPVNRLHSLNRQKEYVTPSKRDVLCPYFDRTFLRTGVADVTNTYCAICNVDDNEAACDYRESVLDLHLCKRYWADPTLNLELVKKDPVAHPPVWQEGEVIFNYERPFANRTATVQLALLQEVPSYINLGNFMLEWIEWSENEKGNWVQQYNASANRDEILNLKNQNGRSFWYNPLHMSLDNYTHEFYVQARASDDDMYGSVFRYTGSSYYSFEWDSGGMGINGMALYRNVYTSGKWIKTMLSHSPVYWGDGKSYIHKVAIKAVKNRINITVHRMSGATPVLLAKLEYLDLDPTAPTHGAWGPMTNSQPSTYFWGLKMYNLLLLSDVENKLVQHIPLEYDSHDGTYHLVSKPMSHYFTDKMKEQVAASNGLPIDEIASSEYWLVDTNVLEVVQFSKFGAIHNVTEDNNAQIAMPLFPYDGAILPFEGYLTAPVRGTSYSIGDTTDIDKGLSSIIFKPHHKRFFDTALFTANGVTAKYVPNVDSGEHAFIFSPPIQLEKNEVVQLVYYANTFELEYYHGDYVDTHDKIFKIEGNKLYWHHVPAYGNEEES